MKIYYLNGPRLLRALLAGSDWVILQADYLIKIGDSLIVAGFPVIIRSIYIQIILMKHLKYCKNMGS